MTLTSAEKRAGRDFRVARREALVARWERYPGAAVCAPEIVWYRHRCGEKGSQALYLRQHYEISPEYWACYCGQVSPGPGLSFPHDDCDGGKLIVPAGFFAFIWREATCSSCGFTVRSGSGKLVLAGDSLPEKGAVMTQMGKFLEIKNLLRTFPERGDEEIMALAGLREPERHLIASARRDLEATGSPGAPRLSGRRENAGSPGSADG